MSRSISIALAAILVAVSAAGQATSTAPLPPPPLKGVKVISPPPPPPRSMPPIRREAPASAPTTSSKPAATPSAPAQPSTTATKPGPTTPAAQTAPKPVTPPPAASPAALETASTFSDTISVGYTMISFAVTDGRGRAVSTLKSKDVSLQVDGKPVVTDMFEKVENAPISFTILLDASGSMGLAGKMEGARMAVAALLGLRRKDDDFALYTFAKGAVVEVVPFTTDARRILAAMHTIEPWGKTAFYDALAAMPDKSLLGGNGAKAIILITDGLDNASSMTREELATALEGVSVPIYPLTIRFPIEQDAPPDAEEGLDLQLLQQLADASGGRMAVETEIESLQAAVKAMHGDLRSQYLIGFTPTGKGGVKYRRFSIRLAKSSWKVRARSGYSGTEPPLRQTTRKR